MTRIVSGIVLLATASAWAGPTKHVGQELTKGAADQVKKEVGSLDFEKAGRSLTRGVFKEVRAQLGESEICRGDDRADCVEAMIGRFSYAFSKYAARGAADETRVWPSVLLFAGGLAAGLVASALIALLVGRRHRPSTSSRMTGVSSAPEPIA